MFDLMSAFLTSSTFVVDVSGVEGSVRDFPNGPLEATVKEAKLDVAKSSGNQMVVMKLEVYHPSVGTAVITDRLPSAFPAKVKAFWKAVNDFTEEEIAANPQVEIDPPSLIGAQLIVQLGTKENKDTGATYKDITPPWYYPLSRAAELLGENDPPL